MGEQLRAYRYALDPTPAQMEDLARYAGAARWAFNHALSAKVAAHQRWRTEVQQLVDAGTDLATARRQVKIPVPTKPSIQKSWIRVRGDSRVMAPGMSPWWHEVSSWVFLSAFADADRAWGNWLASIAGGRSGRPYGYPRWKKRGRSRDSFRIYHNVKNPVIRPVTYRRLMVPKLGEFRVHGTMKPLVRALARGEALVQSVTISRAGDRWYASVLCKTAAVTRLPSRAQTDAGAVGIDLGVKVLATLSTGEQVTNPRRLAAATKRLVKAQRTLARSQRGSRRRAKARARLGRRHAEVAAQRAAAMHELTKRLASGWSRVVVEDLNVTGMTRSPRGTIETPGSRVRAKAGLNRSILDASFGMIRRQLEYKTRWYGSELVVIDRWAPTSKTCSTCGWRNPSQTLVERTFDCQSCGTRMDRDLNAALNIRLAGTNPAAWQAAVASGSGETRNARGGPATPTPFRVGYGSMNREDTRPVSPQQSDLLALLPPA